MQLHVYLAREGLRPQDFARWLGVSRAAVERYVAGRVPRASIVARIHAVTAGEVTAADLHHLAPAAPKRRQSRTA